VNLNGTLMCKDAAAAEQLKKDANDLLGTLRVAAQAQPALISGDLKTSLDTLEAKTSGSKVTINFSISNDALVGLIKPVMMMNAFGPARH
jgi:hypothetical protein